MRLTEIVSLFFEKSLCFEVRRDLGNIVLEIFYRQSSATLFLNNADTVAKLCCVSTTTIRGIIYTPRLLPVQITRDNTSLITKFSFKAVLFSIRLLLTY